jgi:uncharacterized spore protein YtfJ
MQKETFNKKPIQTFKIEPNEVFLNESKREPDSLFESVPDLLSEIHQKFSKNSKQMGVKTECLESNEKLESANRYLLKNIKHFITGLI